jgi:hypothetical protein
VDTERALVRVTSSSICLKGLMIFRTNPSGSTRYEGLWEGPARAIRNQATRDLNEPNEAVALEVLATLSFSARPIDDAVREDG